MYHVQQAVNTRSGTSSQSSYFQIGWRNSGSVVFTGNISSTTLNVTAMLLPVPGIITVGMPVISGTAVTGGTYITNQLYGASGASAVSSTATGTSGTNTLTVTPLSTLSMDLGYLVCGNGATITGIPASTYITAISGTTVTLSNMLTGSISTTVYFYKNGSIGSYTVNNSQTVSSTTMCSGGTVFLATTSSTTLTVTSVVNGTVAIGTATTPLCASLLGNGTYISALGTGTGGTGTYTLNQTVAPAISSATAFVVTGYVNALTYVSLPLSSTGNWSNSFGTIRNSDPREITTALIQSVPDQGFTGSNYFSYNIQSVGSTDFGIGTGLGVQGTVTGAITGNVLNVTAVTSGSVSQSGYLTSATSSQYILANTYVISQLSGTGGGVGSYLLNNYQTFASGTITVQQIPGTAITSTATTNTAAGLNVLVSDYPYTSPLVPVGFTGSSGKVDNLQYGNGTGTVRLSESYPQVANNIPIDGSIGRFFWNFFDFGVNPTTAKGMDRLQIITPIGNTVFNFDNGNHGMYTAINSLSGNKPTSEAGFVGYQGSSNPASAVTATSQGTIGSWYLLSTDTVDGTYSSGPVGFYGSSSNGYTGSLSTNQSGAYMISTNTTPNWYVGQTITGASVGTGAQVVAYNGTATNLISSSTMVSWPGATSYTASGSIGTPYLILTSSVPIFPGQTITGTGITSGTYVQGVFPNYLGGTAAIVISTLLTSTISLSTVVIGVNSIVVSGYTGSTGYTGSGVNIPSNTVVVAVTPTSTSGNYLLILNQSLSSSPTGTITHMLPAYTTTVTVPCTGFIGSLANYFKSNAAFSGTNYIGAPRNPAGNYLLYGTEITLYSTPFAYTKDIDGYMSLGYVNATNSTTASIQIKTQPWAVNPSFFLKDAILPPGLTLSTSGLISGTVNTTNLQQGNNRFVFNILALYAFPPFYNPYSGNNTQGFTLDVYIDIPAASITIPAAGSLDIITATVTAGASTASTGGNYSAAGTAIPSPSADATSTITPNTSDPRRTSVIVIG